MPTLCQFSREILRYYGIIQFHLSFAILIFSEAGVFCTFWLQNVLRATTACAFSTSQLPKVVRARRFSEPTFRPSGATSHWKNTVNRDFSTFSRTCIFFLLTLSLLWSSLFFSSLFWLFPPLLFHLSILSEVSLLNFLRIGRKVKWYLYICIRCANTMCIYIYI